MIDPFMGSGSTVAAAEAIGYTSIGIERLEEYYSMSQEAIPKLSQLITEQAQLGLSIA